MAIGMDEKELEDKARVANIQQDLHVLPQQRQAPKDLGVQKHGVRMQGQEQQMPKRQAEWTRDR